MGIFSSYEWVSVETAKLIHPDGQLQEFSYPVRVLYVLQKYPYCFICNYDEMDFGNYVSAIHGDEELQLGYLYFVLPLSMKSCSTSNRKHSAPLVFSVTNQMKNINIVGNGGGDGRVAVVGNKHKRCSSRGRDFESNLNVITK
ncbi:hypothetical protein MKX01_005705 [Papaver californicum]|nr:hypothetical protein MKX01_005705 [Papaver californicum]